jgi:signal transduction histidine kinase
MPTTVLVIAAICLGVGLAALLANPRRFPNQVFAGTAVLVALWLWFVQQAIKSGAAFAHDHTQSPLPWLRANAALSTLFPWMTYLLSEAVAGEVSRLKAFRRTLPLFFIGLGYAYLCYTDAFIPSTSTPANPRHGPLYTFSCATALLIYALLIAHTYARMRRQKGLRRVEMQFLSMNLAITFPLVILTTALGNVLHLLLLKYCCFIVLLGSYALSGWALTVHRLYEARQIFVSFLQRVAVISALAAAVWVVRQWLGGSVPAPADLLASVAMCSPVALWLDRASRRLLDLDGERRLAQMRSAVIAVARTEPSTDDLVFEFERLLRAHTGASFAALLIDRGEAFVCRGMQLRKGQPAFAALVELGWATPEALDRRRTGAGAPELLEYLKQHELGVIVTVPGGSPAPSLLVALGPKTNCWPFTYPEVQRIQETAGVIDNILVRSRLAAEDALKTKVDHLAMMSRGLAHDLKNLITPISSFLVHTRDRYPPGSVEEEVHAAARRSVGIIADYVGEALFFAKQLTPRFEPVVIERVLATVDELTRGRAERRGVAVVTASELTGPFAGDVVLIQRLLVNLTNNAIDASLAGGNVAVTASRSRPGFVRLQVKDEGEGIPPENTRRIFEPYFTTKQFGDEMRGFGLGLTISEKIVALHHGTITVQSRVGTGTTIAVELPEFQAGESAPGRPTRTPGAAGRNAAEANPVGTPSQLGATPSPPAARRPD